MSALTPRTEPPTLEALRNDLALAVELTPAQAARLLAELAAVNATLVARVVAGGEVSKPAPTQDQMLTAEQVAARFNRSVAWVYRQAKFWPFTRRISRKTVRFSDLGLVKWLAQQRD